VETIEKAKRKSFKLAKMAVETKMSEERIKEILRNPKKDQVRNSQKSKLLNNGALNKYPNLSSAKKICELSSGTDSEYLEAFEVWEWYAFCKVTKACTLSLLIDALDDSPKGSFPESLAVQRIAVQFGFAGKEDLN